MLIPPLKAFFTRLRDSFYAEKVFFSLFVVSFFIVIAVLFVTTIDRGGLAYLELEDFAVGKVAERDVVANRDISYTDQQATEIRKAARLQTIAPIFRQDADLVSTILKKYDEFVSSVLLLHSAGDTAYFEP